MRVFGFIMAVGLLAGLVACNSQDGITRGPERLGQNGAPPKAATPQVVSQAPNSIETARRITAQELHKLWQKDEVLIVDTRNEASFKQGHIRGSILIPAHEFNARADELPKGKMIVMYCT